MKRQKEIGERIPGAAVAGLIAALASLSLLTLAAPRAVGSDAPPALLLTPAASATPTAVQTVDLGAAVPIGCDQALAGDTTGAAANVDAYLCAPAWPETGPEDVYALTAPGDVTVDMQLGGLAEDLDLFVLTGSSPASCIASGDNSVSLPNLAAGVYYVVIDGFDGAAGAYRLNVWCPLNPSPQASPTPTPTATAPFNPLRLYLPLISARS